MWQVLARFRVIIGSAFLLSLGAGIFLLFGPLRLGEAGEFDNLMDEAIERGTQVDAARARRDAAEASVRKAWSRFLPSINAHGDYGYNRNNAFGRMKGLDREHYDTSSYGISASMPIFRGGANYYGLKGAKASAEAEQHSYHEARQLLLLDTARAIFGIIRDREIVTLQRENQSIVTSILRTTEARFRGGESTRTDIAIARDQLTASQSVYTQAIDNLRANETEFQRIIGRAPGRLSVPRGLAGRLPKSLGQAVTMAESQNPQLLAAIFRSEAADHALSASYSKFLPKVDLNMDYTEDRYHDGPLSDESDFSVKLNFSIPLFQPEALPERDESQHLSEQRRFEARDARFSAKAMATVAWRSYHTARKRYQLSLSRIRAARAASTGMRRELEAGQRTVLDVLDTQERLVNARVEAASAKYEQYMSAHLLLSAIGELDASSTVVSGFKGYVNSAEKVRARGDTGWRMSKLGAAQRMKLPAKQLAASRTPAKAEILPWQTGVDKKAVKKVAYEPRGLKSVTPTKIETPALAPATKPVKQVRLTALPQRKPIVADAGLVTGSLPLPKGEEPQLEVKRVIIKRPKAVAAPVKTPADASAKVYETEKVPEAVVKVTPKAVVEAAVEAQVEKKSEPEKLKAVEEEKPRLKPSVFSALRDLWLSKEPIVTQLKSQEPDPVVTGAIRKKTAPPLKVEKAPAPEAPDAPEVAPEVAPKVAAGSLFQAFRVHKIPLPERKGAVRAAAKIKTRKRLQPIAALKPAAKLSRRVKAVKAPVVQTQKRTVEEYPDTLDNRFSMWWNKQVDKVIGPAKGPRKVLVPLDEYRQKNSD